MINKIRRDFNLALVVCVEGAGTIILDPVVGVVTIVGGGVARRPAREQIKGEDQRKPMKVMIDKAGRDLLEAAAFDLVTKGPVGMPFCSRLTQNRIVNVNRIRRQAAKLHRLMRLAFEG